MKLGTYLSGIATGAVMGAGLAMMMSPATDRKIRQAGRALDRKVRCISRQMNDMM